MGTDDSAQDLASPAESIGDLLESAHREVVSGGGDDTDDKEKVPRKGRKVNYKKFGMDEVQLLKEYDADWVYMNLGTTPDERVGQPTRSGEELLKRLNSDPDAKLKFMMDFTSMTVKSMDKRNASRVEAVKTFEDDGREHIAFIEQLITNHIKNGIGRR